MAVWIKINEAFTDREELASALSLIAMQVRRGDDGDFDPSWVLDEGEDDEGD